MTGRLRNMTATYISCGEKMLLLWRVGSRVIPPCWCGIGGHFENDELNDARACALRELYEETGFGADRLENMKLRYVALRSKNGEIWQNYYFFADLKCDGGELPLPESGEGRLEWVDYSEILKRDMPYCAKAALKHYMAEGRYTDIVYGGAAVPSGIDFTGLTEF